MKLPLNENQISYIFYHLNHHFKFTLEIRSRFHFGNASSVKNRIIFPLSDREVNIRYIDEIPVLYPIAHATAFYSLDKNNNIIFHHDLLKSAFHLLSGYQETLPFKEDAHGRFSYGQSIQKQLNMAEIPLVNVYFDIIIEGIDAYCQKHGLKFERRDWWDNHPFAFVLTHDVDRIDKNTFHNLKLYIKQSFGIKSSSSKRQSIRLFFKTLFKLFGDENPYWNFDWMKKVENKFGLHSAWYFLPKGKKHLDAYYSFDENRIGELIKILKDSGDEIGLHGTFHSRLDKQIMKENYDALTNLLGGRLPVGCRQHWLSFKYPETLRIMKSIGIQYDSSWAFADHIGWRNSYCWPFRPWDFEYDRMMNIWEIPLSIMDTTLFSYQKYTFPEAKESIQRVLEQVKKYRGVLVMLWHNSSLDDEDLKGISNFYEDLLEYVSRLKIKSILPAEIITKFDGLNYEKT